MDMGGPKGGLGTLVGEVWDHLCVGATRYVGQAWVGALGGHTLWRDNTLDMGDTLGWR